MSPELETLDQLIAGDIPLTAIRNIYSDQDRFTQGMSGLLSGGEIRLLEDGFEVPKWRWPEVLAGDLAPVSVSLTDAGARRIA